MSPRFILGRENVPCVAEVVNRSLKADCTNYTNIHIKYNIPFLLSKYQNTSLPLRNITYKRQLFLDKSDNIHYIYKSIQSTFTKLWQSCSNPHLKIRPIAIFAFYSLNYSLAARLQDNSRPKSPTMVETKRKLQQFTVSGWLIINGGARDTEKRKL